jgi:hypothetical protein
MSGNRPGGQNKLVISKKNLQYSPDPGNPGNVRIEKQSEVEAQTPKPAAALQLKLGLRVKQSQTIEDFEVRFKPGPDGVLPLHLQPADSPIAHDLTTALGRGPDERWATYLADYDPAFGTKFTTKLRLSPFAVHPNGFQIVTVAFTHANHQFATDNYVFGLSLLPGRNNAGSQLNLGGGSAPSSRTKKYKKAPAKASSARKRSKAGKSRGAARRKR